MIQSRGDHSCTLCHPSTIICKVRDQQPSAQESKQFNPNDYVYVLSRDEGEWNLFLYQNGERTLIDLEENNITDKESLEDLYHLSPGISESLTKEFFDIQKTGTLTDRYYAVSNVSGSIERYHFNKNKQAYKKNTITNSNQEAQLVIDDKYIVTFPEMITHYLNKSDTQTLHGWDHPWMPDKWFLQAIIAGSKISFPPTDEQLKNLPQYKVGYLTTKTGKRDETLTEAKDVIDTHGGDINLPALKDKKNEALFKVNFGSLEEKQHAAFVDTLETIIHLARAHYNRKDEKPISIVLANLNLIEGTKEFPDPAKSDQHITQILKETEQEKKEKVTATSQTLFPPSTLNKNESQTSTEKKNDTSLKSR